MAGFLVKLEYKCAWYGADFEKADRWFPSSKLCAHCGWHNAQMTLSDRQWYCGGCGALVERDFNAALNLEQWPGSSFPMSGRGDCVSPAMPAVVGEASTSTAPICESPIVRLSPNPPMVYGGGGQTRDEGSGNVLART